MKLKFSIIVFLISFIIVYFLLNTIDLESDNRNIGVYWLLLIIIAIPIIKFLFPKLREMGIGSAEFIPNLFKFLRK